MFFCLRFLFFRLCVCACVSATTTPTRVWEQQHLTRLSSSSKNNNNNNKNNEFWSRQPQTAQERKLKPTPFLLRRRQVRSEKTKHSFSPWGAVPKPASSPVVVCCCGLTTVFMVLRLSAGPCIVGCLLRVRCCVFTRAHKRVIDCYWRLFVWLRR